MRVIAIVLTLAGLAMCAAYPLANQNSGKRIWSYNVVTTGGERDLRKYFRQPAPFSPLSIDLDPSMNPVTLYWDGKISFQSDSEFAYRTYDVVLSLGNERLIEKSINVKGDRSGSGDFKRQSIEIGTVNVRSAGIYQLTLRDRPTHNDSRVSTLDIEVRSKVKPVNYKIVWAGVALVLVGCVIGSLFGKIEQT